MAGFTHHGGARIVVFVSTVTEAHQAEKESFLSFARRTNSGMCLTGADFFQHFRAASLAPPCAGPHRSDPGGNAGERVGAA